MISTHKVQSIFDSMQENSAYILKSIVGHRLLETTSSSVFVFGSTRRYECLPQGDLDVVVHTPNVRQWFQVREALDAVRCRHNLDKIEIFMVNKAMPLIDIVNGQTPDAGCLDVLPVVISFEGLWIAKLLQTCTNLYNDPHRLAIKMLSEYYFSRMYNNRSQGLDINLKYTPGGYRDILYLDLYARIFGGANYKGVPEIRESIGRVVHDLQLGSEDAQMLKWAVAWVIQVKSAILDLCSGTQHRGRAPMNLATATLLTKSRYRSVLALPSLVTPEEIVSRHLTATRTLSATIDRLVSLSDGPLWSYLPDSDRKVANTIRGIWLGDVEAVSRATHSIGSAAHYGILSALICTDVLDAPMLDTLARTVASQPSYVYLNRLLIKSAKTHITTIKYILDNNRISWDAAVEKRYRALAKRRVGADGEGIQHASKANLCVHRI